MSEAFTYDLPTRAFRPDWTLGYCLALIAVGLFFSVSFVLYSYGSVAPIVSGGLGLAYAILVLIAAGVMTVGGGGMAMLPFFLVGSALFFGLGTYFSVTVTRSSLFFTEGQQWQMLPQVNMVNSTAILCVLLAAGIFAARRPAGSEKAPDLSERLDVMYPFLKLALALAAAVAAVEWLTFPNVQDLLLATIMRLLYGVPVFGVFLGCALWSKARNYERATIVLLVFLIAVEGLLSGQKMTFIMPFMAAALGLWISERYRMIAIVIVGIVVGLYITMLSSVVPHVRGHVLYDPYNNSLGERVTIVHDVLSTIEERTIEETNQSTLSRLSPTQFSAHFIASYDNNFPGESLDKAFVVLVPRVLWPEKPIINPGKHFDSVWRDWDIFSSLAIGFPAEAYWNNGWAGVVAVSLYVGLMLGWFSRKWFLFRRDGWTHCGVFLLSPVLVKSALWVETNIVGSYIGGWIKYALIILAIDYSIRLFIYLRMRFEASFEDPLAVDIKPRSFDSVVSG